MTTDSRHGISDCKSESIGRRISNGMKAAKARGVVLGNPKLAEVRGRGVATLKAEADRFATRIAPVVVDIRESGILSLRGIAAELNARGIPTVRGGVWTVVQVTSILRRMERAISQNHSQ